MWQNIEQLKTRVSTHHTVANNDAKGLCAKLLQADYGQRRTRRLSTESMVRARSNDHAARQRWLGHYTAAGLPLAAVHHRSAQ